jgi:hypothetical protein
MTFVQLQYIIAVDTFAILPWLPGTLLCIPAHFKHADP